MLRSCPALFALVNFCNYFKNSCHWVIYKQQKFIPHSSRNHTAKADSVSEISTSKRAPCSQILLWQEMDGGGESSHARAHAHAHTHTTHRSVQTGSAPNFTLQTTRLLFSQEGLNFKMNFGGVTDCPNQDSSHKGKSAPGRDAES